MTNTQLESFLIYQSTDTTSQLNSLLCSTSLTNSGYTCILSLSKLKKMMMKNINFIGQKYYSYLPGKLLLLLLHNNNNYNDNTVTTLIKLIFINITI